MTDNPTATGDAHDGRLSGLVERLRRAKRRWAVNATADVAAMGVLVALAVFCLLQSLHALLGSLAPSFAVVGRFAPGWTAAWSAPPFLDHAAIATGIGLAAVAVGIFLAVSRRPGIKAMARKADARFEMRESLSTALEVSEAPARWPGVVSQALLLSAGARADAVDARRLVPVRMSRTAIGVPVLLLAAVALTYAPPPPLLQDAVIAIAPALDEPARTQEEQQRTAANLRVIAEILRRDGETRADAGIQAIAQALDRLSDQVAADRAMPDETVTEELGRLLGLARDAYDRVGENETSRHLARLIAGLNDAAPNRPRGDYQDANFNEGGGGERPDYPEVEDNPLAGLLTTREYVGIEDFDDLVPPETIIGDPRVDRRRGGDGPPDALAAEDLTRTYHPDDADYGEDGPNIEGPAAGVMVGAGDGFGAADYAGDGERALFGDAVAPGAPIGVDGEMLLQNPGMEGGRRIRFDLPPQMGAQAFAGGAAVAAGNWQTLTEERVTRSEIPAPDRDAVSRYFETLRLGNGE